MNKILPKFLLLTDPYQSIQGRVLILRAHEPRYIFEINHPEDVHAHSARQVTVEGQTYLVAVRRRLTEEPQVPTSLYNDVARWYHFTKPENAPKE